MLLQTASATDRFNLADAFEDNQMIMVAKSREVEDMVDALQTQELNLGEEYRYIYERPEMYRTPSIYDPSYYSQFAQQRGAEDVDEVSEHDSFQTADTRKEFLREKALEASQKAAAAPLAAVKKPAAAPASSTSASSNTSAADAAKKAAK